MKKKSTEFREWWKAVQWELLNPDLNVDTPEPLNMSDFQDGYTDAMERVDRAVQNVIAKLEKQ